MRTALLVTCGLVLLACTLAWVLIPRAKGPTTQPSLLNAAQIRARIAGLQRQPQTPEVKRPLAGFELARMASSDLLNRDAVSFRARLVDEAGKELDNVTAVFATTKMKAFATAEDGAAAPVTNADRQIVSKVITVSATKILDAKLFLEKDGYYPETVYFSSNPDTQWASVDRFSSKKLADGTLEYTVVLEKRGTIAAMTESSLKLRVDAAGGGVLAVLENDQFKAIDYQDRAGAVAKHPHALWVSLGPVEDGKLPLRNRTPDMTKDRDKWPQVLTIGVGNMADGLLRKKCRAGRFERQMRMAPAEGYGQEISFTGEELIAAITRSEGDCAFFFKIGDKFGRGVVWYCRADVGGKAMNVKVRLQLQPDGSRNLETGE